MKRFSKRTDTFDVINSSLLIIFTIIILYPILNIVSMSVSSDAAVVTGRVSFYPIGFQINTLGYVMGQRNFWYSFTNSILITAIGTVLSLFLTVITAYPLSKVFLPGRKIIVNIYIFMWIFLPGIIPLYLLIRQLNLLNNLAALILPDLIIAFNMLVVKNFFESIPEGLTDAANIDGASVIRTLFQVVVPVSKPVLATVGLFYAIFYWNSYINATMFINEATRKPLQLYLFELIANSMGVNAAAGQGIDAVKNVSNQNIRAASIVISMIPMLCLYPFIQKYFVQGIMIGSVKG
jgi:putative aldouronate transport system permease protein